MRCITRLRTFLLVLLLAVSCSAMAAKKVSNKISVLDFNDITVGDALRILSKQSNLNFISSKAAAKIEMTMFLRDIDPMDVLDSMAKTYNLWYQEDKNSKVIRIYTVREFRLGKVDYRNEKTEVFTFKHQRTSLDFAYMIQDLFGYDRVALSQGADENDVANDLYDRLERFDIIARNTFTQSESAGNNSGFGISSGGSGGNNGNQNNNNNNNNNNNSQNNNNSRNGNNQNGNNRNNRQNNRGNNRGQTMSLGRNQALDLTNMLPGEEAASMLSGSHDLSAGAVDLLIEHISPIYVTMVRRQNRVLVRTRDKDALKDIQELYTKLNIDMATLLLEVKVLEIALNDGYESNFEFNIKSGDFQVTRAGSQEFVDSATNAADLVRAALGDPAMVASVVSKNFDARLTLLEQEGRVTALATPMLTTTNQEVSRTFIGEERPITSGIDVECPNIATTGVIGTPVNQGVCVQDPQTEIRPIGKTLLLTPNINADGTVDIRLLVEDSSVCDGCGKIPAQSSNGQIVNYEVDTINTQTFSGDIIAQNTQLIAVGGLISERSSDVEKKVPILGDIPYLGFFFSETKRERRRTEMVILIRPYVMNNNNNDIDVNKPWLEQNSIHPSADNMNHLDIYKNSEHFDNGFELQPDYRTYLGQDKFDGYHEKGAGATAPEISEPEQVSSKQATYTELTQYAAKSVRLPEGSREHSTGINNVSLKGAHRGVPLLYDNRLRTAPIASWRKGGVYVTALEVNNMWEDPVKVDYVELKGQWLAATIENDNLAGKGEFGDATYLYLISAMPFEQALEQLN